MPGRSSSSDGRRGVARDPVLAEAGPEFADAAGHQVGVLLQLRRGSRATTSPRAAPAKRCRSSGWPWMILRSTARISVAIERIERIEPIQARRQLGEQRALARGAALQQLALDASAPAARRRCTSPRRQRDAPGGRWPAAARYRRSYRWCARADRRARWAREPLGQEPDGEVKGARDGREGSARPIRSGS